MKHALAVAVQEGFTASIAAEVQNGTITLGQAEQITRFALAIVREYLRGNSPMGKPLHTFARDGEKWETFLNAHKINLQQFGD
jgi:hypothetical protein